MKQLLKAKATPVDAPVAPTRTQAAPLQEPAPSDTLDSAIECCADVGGVAAAQSLIDKMEWIRRLSGAVAAEIASPATFGDRHENADRKVRGKKKPPTVAALKPPRDEHTRSSLAAGVDDLPVLFPGR